MHGVVSLLDNHHYQLTESLWRELEMQFGLRGIYITPYPHFPYQAATGYDVNTLEPILKRIAKTTSPFQVKAAGSGIFTGKSPVLYIPWEITINNLAYIEDTGRGQELRFRFNFGVECQNPEGA